MAAAVVMMIQGAGVRLKTMRTPAVEMILVPVAAAPGQAADVNNRIKPSIKFVSL